MRKPALAEKETLNPGEAAAFYNLSRRKFFRLLESGEKLMGHSDIGVTLNVYTHLGLEDAAAEMARMEEVETARKEQEKISGKKDRENKVTQKMFRAV